MADVYRFKIWIKLIGEGRESSRIRFDVDHPVHTEFVHMDMASEGRVFFNCITSFTKFNESNLCNINDFLVETT
jgi:hypothetical protein